MKHSNKESIKYKSKEEQTSINNGVQVVQDIVQLRQKIDAIDEQISDLLFQRYQTVSAIGKQKAREALPIYDSKREYERLLALQKRFAPPYLYSLESVWRTIMRTSRSLQYGIFTRNKVFSAMDQRWQKMATQLGDPQKMGFCGDLNPDLINHLQESFPQTLLISIPSFQSAFRQLQEEKVDYIFLPLEDSVSGSYTEVYHLLAEEGVFIADSYRTMEPYYLLTLPGATLADLRTIIAHPKIIGDCLPFVRNMGWNTVEEQKSTVVFEKMTLANERTTATIGTRLEALRYGLEMHLPVPVQAKRQLRYVLIGRHEVRLPQLKYLILSFLLPNQPHALESCVSLISDYGFNIHKLRTHYLEEETWNQKVFVELDVQGQTDSKMSELLTILNAETNQFRLLGLCPEHFAAIE